MSFSYFLIFMNIYIYNLESIFPALFHSHSKGLGKWYLSNGNNILEVYL